MCQGIHIKLFMRCRNELRGEIEQKLGILDENGMNTSTKYNIPSLMNAHLASERCMELMAEDRERQVRRMHLQKEKEKLDKAQGWLKVAEKTPEPLFCDSNSVLP